MTPRAVVCFKLLPWLLALVGPSRGEANTSLSKNCTHIAVEAQCSDGDGCITLEGYLTRLSSLLPLTDCVSIHLSVGTHSLVRPEMVTGNENASVAFHGGDGVTVSCVNSNASMVRHSIHLTGLRSVAFHHVRMQNCHRPLRLENIRNVTVWNSVFLDFSSGAVDIYNCLHSSIVNCTFMNNTGTSVIDDSKFRGNAGGLAIGVHQIPYMSDTVTFLVEHCEFIRNKADPLQALSASNVQSGQIFTGRGGGIGVFISGDLSVNGVVQNCSFYDNFARSFGGGTYFLMSGLTSRHFVQILDCFYGSNEAGIGGGGAIVGYLHTGEKLKSFNKVEFLGCDFISNTAPYGGGTYFVPGLLSGEHHFVSLRNCTFVNNGGSGTLYGAAAGLTSFNYFSQHESAFSYEIVNCSFISNTGSSGGTVGISYSSLVMSEHNYFINNTGPALRVIGATVHLFGNISFEGNNAESVDGGALYVTSFGQLLLNDGASLSFKNNRGSLGSAVVVEPLSGVSVFASSALNSLCFLRYSDEPLPPLYWKGVNMEFSGNSALIGPVAYMGNLDECSWNELGVKPIQLSTVLRWPFVHIEDDNLNLAHPAHSRTDPQLYVQTPAVDLNVSNIMAAVAPGERMVLRHTAFDQLGHPTSAILRVNAITETRNKTCKLRPNYEKACQDDAIHIGRELLSVEPRSDTSNVKFSVRASDYASDKWSLGISIVDVLDAIPGDVIKVVPFEPVDCLPGYHLSSDGSTGTENCDQSSGPCADLVCVCDTVHISVLVHCESNRDELILKPNLWATVDFSSGEGLLWFRTCPTGYCNDIYQTSLGKNTYSSVYSLSNPDQQCAGNRTGILCGSCPVGYAVSSLLNRCVKCTNILALLLAALVIADLVIAAALVWIDKPLPMWLYPCLYFVQVTPYITESFSITFEVIRPYMLYFSSGLAFYLPFDTCLYSSTSALASYALRFIPLFCALIVTFTTLMLRWLCRQKLRLIDCHGIWTLCLLMYSHIVYTAVSVLHCPQVPHRSGKTAQWYVNGDIQCFSGGHIPLAILSILVLVFALLAVPVSAIIAKKKWTLVLLEHLWTPLTCPFNSKLSWWGAVALSRRLLLIVVVVLLPGQLIAPAFVLMFSMTVYMYVQPYKSRVANILEAVLSVNSVLLVLVASNAAISEGLIYVDSTQLSPRLQPSSAGTTRGVTRLTAMMAASYFLPLAILLVGVAVWLLLTAWNYFSTKWKKRTTDRSCNNQELEEPDMYEEGQDLQHISCTYIEITEGVES